MSYTIPSDAHVASDPGHPDDHNNLVDVIKGMGAVYNILNTAYSGGADPTGTNDSAAPIQDTISAAISGGGGWVYVPPGNYKQLSGVSASLNGTSVRIWLEAGAKISYYGSGDCWNIYDSSTYGSRTAVRSGIFGLGIIDGINSSSSAASAALHVGDMPGFGVYITVANWHNYAGSIGAHFDNRYFWTEQLYGRIYAQSCGTGVMFDNSAGTSGGATGSFERMKLEIILDQAGSGDGVTFNNGAFTANHELSIRGNFSTSTTQYAALRLTGSNGGGSSRMTCGILNMGCELDDTVHTAPYSIYFNAGGNVIQNCTGILDFSQSHAFTAANNTGQFWYSGITLGDSELAAVPPATPANAQSVNANGATIFPNLFGLVTVGGAGGFTGVILQAGTYSGQSVTVINTGGGSITFAASGTSNVADGTSDVIAQNTARTFVWDTGNSLWYRTG
jgi:hypothetical protein